MTDELLITYATKSGSTAEVARTIGEVFQTQGISVTILPVGQVKAISQYRAVILGSAIRFGNWLPEMLEFVKNNKVQLNQIPVACFTVHILALDNSATSRKQRLAYLDKVRSLITPKAEAFFAGTIDPSRLSLLERLLTKVIKPPTKDQRDWTAIRDWAESLRAELFATV